MGFRLPLAALLGVVLTTQVRETPLLVSAALSLSAAMHEIAQAYARAGGGPVTFNFAASNILARQIVQGAPADVFISADESQMDYAARRGAIDAASRTGLLGNRLAVVTPPGRGAGLPDVRALSGVRRLAIGDPAAVPAGVYARQYLQTVGIWEVLQPRLLPLSNVRAALAAAASGGADAAIVYESDAASASGTVDLAFVVTGPGAPTIIYPAAIVARSRHKQRAAAFLEFLRSDAAQRIFVRHRFSPAGAPPRPVGVLTDRPPRAAASSIGATDATTAWTSCTSRC